MRRSLFSIVTASVLLTGAGLASAQTSSTSTSSTWTNDQGSAISSYSTTQKYNSYAAPEFHATVGIELPMDAALYPLPETLKIPDAEHYSYSIINDHPVVVERTTRKVVHSWD
ncbi:MAG: hypothetical protein QOJ54_57 [Aliidongia sp.]|jgi:hypothetical protein|nr:hypothetical protein [Aliidongia sp.]